MKKLVLLFTLTLTALAGAGQSDPLPRLGSPYKSCAKYFGGPGSVSYGSMIKWQFRYGETLDCKFENAALQVAYFNSPQKPYSSREIDNIIGNMTGLPPKGDYWLYKTAADQTLFYSTNHVYAVSISRDSTRILVGYWAYIQNTELTDGQQ